jgi:hypothetical protein
VSHTVVRDYELSRVPLRKGDTVWVAWGSAARDKDFVSAPTPCASTASPARTPTSDSAPTAASGLTS